MTSTLSLTIPTTTTTIPSSLVAATGTAAATSAAAAATVAPFSTVRLTLRGVHQFDVSAVALARHSTVIRAILELPSACDAARVTNVPSSSSSSLSSSPTPATLEYALPASLAAPSWFVRSTLEYALRDERHSIAPGRVSYSCAGVVDGCSDVASNASTTSLRSLYDSSSSLASELQSPASSSSSSSSSVPSSPSSPAALSPLEVSPLTSPSSTPASSTRSVSAVTTAASSSATITPRRIVSLHSNAATASAVVDETDARFDALLLSAADPATPKTDDVNDAIVLPLLNVAHALGLEAVLSELDTYMLEMYIAKVRTRVSRNRSPNASTSGEVASDAAEREQLSLVLDFLVLAHSFDLTQLAKFVFDDVIEWWPSYRQTSEYEACESALKPHLLQPFSLTSPAAASGAGSSVSPSHALPTLSRTGTLRRGMRLNRSFHILPQGKPKVVLALEQACASRRLLTRKAASDGRRVRCGGSQM